MKPLAPHYRCLSLDLLGFGESSQPAVEYGIALEVEFVSAVARALDLGSYGIVGHSFGAWVAAACALQSAVVTACMLVAPIGLRGDGFGDCPGALWPVLRRSPVARGLSGDLSRWESEKLDGQLGRLQVPVAVVVARDDALVPASCPQTYARAISNAQLQEINGAGHAIPLERPRDLAAAIAAFFAVA